MTARTLFAAVALLIASATAGFAQSPATSGSDSVTPLSMEFKNGVVGPREMESQTKQTVAREYTRAWQTFSDAFDEDRPELLSASFVGEAQKTFANGIAEQKKAGIHTKYAFRSHQPQVIFYAPDGLSIIVRDRVTSDVQIMKGSDVLHSATVTQDYVAVMTPTETSWRVRILQPQPQDQDRNTESVAQNR
jgi:hypothetical protein